MKRIISVLASLLAIIALLPSAIGASATSVDVTYYYPTAGTDDDMGEMYAPSSSGTITERWSHGARTDITVYKWVNGNRTYVNTFIMDTPYNYTTIMTVSSGLYTFKAVAYGEASGQFRCSP